MGIYRYRGHKDGKLRDCRTPERSKSVFSTPKRTVSQWLYSGRFLGGALKDVSLIVTGSAVLATLFALSGVWRSGNNFLEGLVASVNAPQPEPALDLRPMVVQQLQGSHELTTAVFSMQTVVPTSQDRTLGGYVIGTTTLLYVAYGEVRAGVDLGAIDVSDVEVRGDSIRLQLPPPKILDSKIDVNRSEIYDYDRGFLGLGPDVAPELQRLAQQTTLQQIIDAACQEGVLEQANDRAKSTVSQLLMAAGFKQLTIETQTPLTSTCTAPPAPETAPPTTTN